MSQVTKLYIDRDLIQKEPDKLSFYIQNAINDSLRKEFNEMTTLSSSVMSDEKPGGNVDKL